MFIILFNFPLVSVNLMVIFLHSKKLDGEIKLTSTDPRGTLLYVSAATRRIMSKEDFVSVGRLLSFLYFTR